MENFNPYFWNAYLFEMPFDGQISNPHHYTQNGIFQIYNTARSKLGKTSMITSIKDSIITDFGEVLYERDGHSALISLNDDYSINRAIRYTSEKNASILRTFYDERDHLFYLVHYEGKYLYDKHGHSIDTADNDFGKMVLISDDRFVNNEISFVKNHTDFLLTPNPVNSSLRITLKDNPALCQTNYTILDYTGNKIMEGRLLANGTEIDLSPLKAGIYFLKLHDTRVGSFAKSFIKL